ncbi:MAG: DUF1698 domain-containing protein [Spirochaetota bacterium]|nr:DUF1698 domain-containing protein [Spirochaetota bacterium]
MLTKEEIEEKISQVPFWGHSIPLPHGIVTPGKVMDNLLTFEKLNLPLDLSGKRVLDIGTWDGFYSFECEKRGAEVLAIDNCERMQRPDEKEYANIGNMGFETCKAILNSKVQFLNLDVYDITKEKIGTFDIVLFLGVLYHLQHPLLALEKISEVTKDFLIVETEWLNTFATGPYLYYTEGDSYNQDPTNWFIPNTKSLKGMLKDVGFNKIEILHKTPAGLKTSIKTLINFRLHLFGRIIICAYK